MTTKRGFAARYRTLGSRLAVTPNGRAKGPGRVTRASLAVSRKHSGVPLPAELQCHPKALSPTARHPGCITNTTPWGGWFLYYRDKARARGARYFTHKTWPMFDCDPVALYIQGTRVYTTQDINQALGWKRAAESYGVKVEVYV